MGLACVINVLLTDENYSRSDVDDMAHWASNNCPTFHGVKVIDVSDVSVRCDDVYEFHFMSPADVVLFKLTWM